MEVMEGTIDRIRVLVAVDVWNIFTVLVIDPGKRGPCNELVISSVFNIPSRKAERCVRSYLQPLLHFIVKIEPGAQPLITGIDFHHSILIEITDAGHSLQFVGTALEAQFMTMVQGRLLEHQAFPIDKLTALVDFSHDVIGKHGGNRDRSSIYYTHVMRHRFTTHCDVFVGIIEIKIPVKRLHSDISTV